MGNLGARSFGFEQAPDTLDFSIAGVVKLVSKQNAQVLCYIGRANRSVVQIDESTRESHSGKFASFDGTFLPW